MIVEEDPYEVMTIFRYDVKLMLMIEFFSVPEEQEANSVWLQPVCPPVSPFLLDLKQHSDYFRLRPVSLMVEEQVSERNVVSSKLEDSFYPMGLVVGFLVILFPENV